MEYLRLHELQHEANSRFFEMVMAVPEVALISDNKDEWMLFSLEASRCHILDPSNWPLMAVILPH